MPGENDGTVLIGVDLSQANEAYARIEQQIKAVLDRTGANTVAAGSKISATLGNAGETGGTALAKNIEKHAAEAHSKLSSTFADIGKTAAGMFAGGAVMMGAASIGTAIVGVIEKGKALTEYNERLHQSLVVAGMSSGAASKEVDRMAKSAGNLSVELATSKGHVKDVQQQVALLGGKTGESNDQLTTLAIGIEKMSHGTVDAGAAIKAFSKGGTEGAEGLGRLTIAMPMLAEKLKGITDPAEKMRVALAYLKPGLDEIGNSAEANEQRIHNFIGGIEDKVGVALYGAIIAVSSALVAGVKFVGEYADVFLTLGAVVAGVAIYMNAAAIAEGVSTAAASAKSIVLGIQTAVYMTAAQAAAAHAAAVEAGTVAEGSATTATGLLNTVMAMNPIALVVIAVVALVAATILLYNHFTVVRATVNAVGAAFMEFWNTIKTIGAAVGHIIHGMFTLNLSEVTDGIKGAVVAYGTAAQNIGSAAKNAFDKTYEAAQTGTSETGAEIEKATEKTKTWTETIAGLATAFDESLKASKDAVKQGESALSLMVLDGLKNHLTRAQVMHSDAYKKALAEAREQAKQMKLAEKIQKESGVQVEGAKDAKPNDTKSAHDAALRALNDFLEKQKTEVKNARATAVEAVDNATAGEIEKLQKSLKDKVINQTEFDESTKKLAVSETAAILVIDKKFDADELKLLQEAQQKRREEHTKFVDETRKIDEAAGKKHLTAMIDMMQDGEEKERAQESMSYFESLQQEKDALAARETELQTKLGTNAITWAEYHNSILSAQAEANNAEADAFALHQQRLLNIQAKALDERTGVVSAGNAAWQNANQQLTTWLSSRWEAWGVKQNTIVGQIETAVLNSFVGFAAQWLAKQAALFLAQQILGTATAAASAVGVSAAMAAIAAAAAPAAALTSIASFGAADVAGSAGLIATAAVAKGISLTGAAKGGVMYNENGPEIIEPAAVMVDYTTIMAGMAARGIDNVVSRANAQLGGNGQHNEAVLQRLDQIANNSNTHSDTNHNVNMQVKQQKNLRGTAIQETVMADYQRTSSYYRS